jgi:hypothetical protein
MFRTRCLLCLLVFFPFLVIAQDIPESGELGDTLITQVDLFNEVEPLDMTLTFDMKKYQKEKNTGDYMPVQLSIQVNDTLVVEKNVRIKARGAFRRSHCYFAPFWLNIRKADVKNKYLQDVTKMKIVTHCQGSKGYENYVLKEFLIYKIYNILSPVSFRVRLIRIKYVDTSRKDRLTESWAIMIEPEEMLAERNDAVVIKNDKLVMAVMRTEEMALVSMFQYMVGNSDYSIAGRHNMKVLGLPGFGSEGYTPVPYDFDYSGLVNAYYAIPGDNLGISSVRERYFLGPCLDDQVYLKAIGTLEDYRAEIMEMIHEFPYLEVKEKEYMIAYLEEYFTLSSESEFIEMELKSTCR